MIDDFKKIFEHTKDVVRIACCDGFTISMSVAIYCITLVQALNEYTIPISIVFAALSVIAYLSSVSLVWSLLVSNFDVLKDGHYISLERVQRKYNIFLLACAPFIQYYRVFFEIKGRATTFFVVLSMFAPFPLSYLVIGLLVTPYIASLATLHIFESAYQETIDAFLAKK